MGGSVVEGPSPVDLRPWPQAVGGPPASSSMNALSALATAIIWRPPGAVPTTLATGVRQACAGAWRAFEIALAGDVLRHRLGRARDRRVKPCVEAVLALVGPPTPTRARALT